MQSKNARINEQVARNRREMQKIAFDHLVAIRQEEENQIAQLEQERYSRDMEKHKAVEAVKKKKEEEQKAATVNNRDYNVYLREEKRQRDLQEKKTRCAWVVEKDEALEAEKKCQEELRKKQKQVQNRDNKEYRELISKAFLLYKDREQQDQEREKMKAEEESKASQAREEERKRIQGSRNKKQVFKNREKMQQIAFDHLAAIRKVGESQIAQLEQSRQMRDLEKDKADEAEKKREEEDKRVAMVQNQKYNVYLMEEKHQRDRQEKKTRCAWVVEEDEALEAKKRQEELRKKEKHTHTKGYQESISKASVPYKKRQEQERGKVKQGEEERARQAQEEERKQVQRRLNNKEVVKKRQETQQIAFDHLEAIRKEEESYITQLERTRHARDLEKFKAEEAEKKREEEEKRVAMVKNQKYNVYLREEKRQRDLQEKKTRCAWVVDKDKALEAKKRPEELRKKEKQTHTKGYQETVSNASVPYKKRQEQERGKVKQGEEERARQAQEEERKQVQRRLNNKEVVKKRQEMQQIAFDHLEAIRKEEESYITQLERTRHARDLEKVKAEEAEKKREEEEKRAAMVKNQKYNVYLREEKRQRDLQEKKTRCALVVDKDEALETKKRQEELRKKEKHTHTKGYQETVSKASVPYKKRQEQERGKVKQGEEERARQAQEEERKQVQRRLNNKEVVKKRQETQQIAFDHLAAIRKEEESYITQLERTRHARDLEKVKAEEAEKKREEEEKRAAMVKNQKYNVYLREEKSQQQRQRTKP